MDRTGGRDISVARSSFWLDSRRGAPGLEAEHPSDQDPDEESAGCDDGALDEPMEVAARLRRRL